MEVINATGVYNLLPGDIWAGELTYAIPELSHCSVVLGTAKQPHVSIGQVLGYRQCLAVWPNEGTCNALICWQQLHLPQSFISYTLPLCRCEVHLALLACCNQAGQRLLQQAPWHAPSAISLQAQYRSVKAPYIGVVKLL